MGLQGEFLKCLIFEGPSGRLEGLEVRFKFDSKWQIYDVKEKQILAQNKMTS